jgi:hypothetical protein
MGLVELAEPSMGVGLHRSGIGRQMLLRMLAATIGRIEEHGRWRIQPGKRAVVAHIGTEPTVRLITSGKETLPVLTLPQGQITCQVPANPSSSEFHGKCPLPIAQPRG